MLTLWHVMSKLRTFYWENPGEIRGKYKKKELKENVKTTEKHWLNVLKLNEKHIRFSYCFEWSIRVGQASLGYQTEPSKNENFHKDRGKSQIPLDQIISRWISVYQLNLDRTEYLLKFSSLQDQKEQYLHSLSWT